VGGTTKNEEELDFSFLVAVAPVKVAIRVGGVVRSGGSAIDHIPESSVTKDQGNHLAPVGIVGLIIVEERDLILNVLKLWLSRRDEGGIRCLSSGCGNMRSRHGAVLRCSTRCLCARAEGCIRLAVLTSAVRVGAVSGHGHKDASRG